VQIEYSIKTDIPPLSNSTLKQLAPQLQIGEAADSISRLFGNIGCETITEIKIITICNILPQSKRLTATQDHPLIFQFT
jgi:hypothetical protein